MSEKLHEWAKREARAKYPHRNPFLEGGAYMGEERSRQALRDPFADGILHLAARLAEDDVIEAGENSHFEHQWDPTPQTCQCGEHFEASLQGHQLHHTHRMEAAIAAMLAKIAEADRG